MVTLAIIAFQLICSHRCEYLDWLHTITSSSDLVLQVCFVSYSATDVASQDAIYHRNSVRDDPITLTKINHGHISHRAFTGLMAIHNLCLVGEAFFKKWNLYEQSFTSAAGLNVALEQQVLSPCTKRRPANGFGCMESLSFSHSLSFFHPSSPSRLCLASWP